MYFEQVGVRCLLCVIAFQISTSGFTLAQESVRLVADDLNGTWNVDNVGETPRYTSTAKRISTIVDFERLSIWVVFESKGKQDALEFLISDVGEEKITFELDREKLPSDIDLGQSRVSVSEIERIKAAREIQDRTISFYADSSTLTFDIASRSFSLDVDGRSAAKFKKFLRSVPVQAIGIAANERRAKLKAVGIVPAPFDADSDWFSEFLSALEPLADGVLQEYGRKLGAGRAASARETGMAAAAALLRLSAKQ